MKAGLVVVALVAVVMVARFIVRHRRRRFDFAIDDAIARNRFRYRDGMTHMDEALRDRTQAQRLQREEARAAFERRFDAQGSSKLHRVS